MPKFIDYHSKLPTLPPEAAKQMQDMIRAGKADQFGVKPLNLFMGKRGQGYCLTEAPNAEAVCKSHQAQGIALSKNEVTEVTSLV